MIKSDILFTGYYGQLNTGDDAFVEVAAWGAKKIWNRDDLRFLAVNHRLPRVETKIRGYPFSLPKSYSYQQAWLLNNTDYLISAGGSTFQNMIRPNSLKAKAMMLEGKKRLKIGAIGVSVGPYKNKAEEKSNIEYLKRMSFLTLRDKRSYEYVKTLDLPYEPLEAFDLAALLPEIYGLPARKPSDKKIIGVSVCNYERYVGGDISNEKRRNAAIVRLLKELDSKLENVVFKFFIINGNPTSGDAELTRETIQQVGFNNEIKIENYNLNTQSVWNRIASCNFVLTTRLHAGIFACFSDTPFMMVEYHKKCEDFLNDVKQATEYRLGDAEFDLNSIVNTIIDALQHSSILLPSLKQEMIEKSFLNFTQVDL